MGFYNLLFYNQSIDFKYKKHRVLKETKTLVWLKNEDTDCKLKVSKVSHRVWVLKRGYEFETTECNILEKL